MTVLSPREVEVLNIIVEDYIVTAAPVGSRTVSKKSKLKLSPASMRNIMADLTEMGFLAQPHTSAGRIPTVSAFRYYLDTALKLRPLDDDTRRKIQEILVSAGPEMPSILGQASKLLSSFSNQISMVVSPGREDVRWRNIDFIPVKPNLVLAVLVLDGGMIQNKLIETEEVFSADDLTKFSNYLNEHYHGKSLAEVKEIITAELNSARQRLQKIYSRALTLASSTFDKIEERELFVDGTSRILEQAEFSDVNRMRDILQLLEERSRLLTLLDKTIAEQGLKITFGNEEEDSRELHECTVISTAYGHDTQAPGVVGIIGPVRMDYAAVVPVVDYIAKALSSLLKNRF